MARVAKGEGGGHGEEGAFIPCVVNVCSREKRLRGKIWPSKRTKYNLAHLPYSISF